MQNKNTIPRSGDQISRRQLLQDIERAICQGQCHGLMDVLDIIRAAPAANEEPAESCSTCNDNRPYCPTDCPTQFVTRAKVRQNRRQARPA